MSFSHSTLDEDRLAAISSNLEHSPGHAVLCQSPESGYTVLEFAAITIPDALDGPRDYDADDHLAMGDLYGVVLIATVEQSGVGTYDVVEELGAKRLPLRELDQDLSGPATPKSGSKLWTAGKAENYPLYDVERVDDTRFQVCDV